MEHDPDTCRRYGTLLRGEDPDSLRHQVIEIPPITPIVIENRLHRLLCPCCSTSTCAPLPPDEEVSRYGPKLSGQGAQRCANDSTPRRMRSHQKPIRRHSAACGRCRCKWCPQLQCGWWQSNRAARLAEGHGDPDRDGVPPGLEPLRRGGQRAARPWLRQRGGERSLRCLQPSAHKSTPTLLGPSNPRFDGHCRTAWRQHGNRRRVACPATAAVCSVASMEKRLDRLGYLEAMLSADSVGL